MMKDNIIKEDGFIIEFWANIFSFLSKISIFSFIRKKKNDNIHIFVERWVLGNLLLAITTTLIGYYLGNKVKWFLYIIIGYAILRVFEIIIYQLNVLFFDPYRAEKRGKKYEIKSPTRMVILLLHNYVEVMFWYAAIIIALIQLSGNLLDATWGEYVRSNILCIATFDSSGIQEIVGEFYSKLSGIVFLQIISGVIMTIISLARFIGLMPVIDSKND
ncbi:hypothetical protein [Clostridium sp. UBA7503]|uniref:hypothetical protein n=1 Tax=Clostridium sp. UBA7503 TaxID=1946377 RepID=UPI0032165D58